MDGIGLIIIMAVIWFIILKRPRVGPAEVYCKLHKWEYFKVSQNESEVEHLRCLNCKKTPEEIISQI